MFAITPRQSIRRGLAAAVAALAFAAMPASPAHAAAAVSGCFAYAGTAISGLSTNLEYQTTSGAWRWLGGVGATNRAGCVAYTIRGTWQRYRVRIKATGVVTSWNAVLDGATPYYAGGDARSYRLGSGRLRSTSIPRTAPAASAWGVDTAGWLNEMDNACTRPNLSPAMLVACYMDQHGLHGNVVVLDRDGDGVEDQYDAYPNDRTRW